MIPRRIIQTGRDRHLPLKHLACSTNLRLLNPDYEFCFFDDDDVRRFVSREFPEYVQAFDAFPHSIQRYDFFRYLAVYRLGGFYFDLDVLLASDLSPLLTAECVFPFEGLTFSRLLHARGIDWEIGNYAFGASPGHAFLEAVIRNCVRALEEPSWVSPMMRGVPWLSQREHAVLYTTGPGLLTRTLAENMTLAADLTVLFPDDVCDPSGWHKFGDLGVHLMDGSWRHRAGRLRRRLAQRWEAATLTRITKTSQRRGKTRTVKPA
jgi:hypothetical protein